MSVLVPFSERANGNAEAVLLKILQVLESENVSIMDAGAILAVAKLRIRNSMRELERTTVVNSSDAARNDNE